MTKLYLTYEEYREGGEISPGQEDSEWPDYEDINNDWSPKQLLLNKGDNWKVEELELDNVKIGDVVYVIVLRYSTGNTFGRENGCPRFRRNGSSVQCCLGCRCILGS